MKIASCRYADVFNVRRPIDAPNDMDIAVLVDRELFFNVEKQVGNDYRIGERGTAIRGALILNATFVALPHHRNVAARIDGQESPKDGGTQDGGECRAVVR